MPKCMRITVLPAGTVTSQRHQLFSAWFTNRVALAAKPAPIPPNTKPNAGGQHTCPPESTTAYVLFVSEGATAMFVAISPLSILTDTGKFACVGFDRTSR